jgi:hypothetical protein
LECKMPDGWTHTLMMDLPDLGLQTTRRAMESGCMGTVTVVSAGCHNFEKATHPVHGPNDSDKDL